MPQCGLVEKAHFCARTMLVHTLAWPLIAGDLGEVKFLYQLGVFEKPPLSSLGSSGNLLFHNKSRVRVGFRVGQFCSSNAILSILYCARLLTGFQLLFCLFFKGGSHSYGIQRKSRSLFTDMDCQSFCLIGHLCAVWTSNLGMGFS